MYRHSSTIHYTQYRYWPKRDGLIQQIIDLAPSATLPISASNMRRSGHHSVHARGMGIPATPCGKRQIVVDLLTFLYEVCRFSWTLQVGTAARDGRVYVGFCRFAVAFKYPLPQSRVTVAFPKFPIGSPMFLVAKPTVSRVRFCCCLLLRVYQYGF